MDDEDLRLFRKLCSAHGVSVTQQRLVILEVLHGMPGHPNPEEIYAEVRNRIPDISLATVYRNISLFMKCGVLTEVSFHHGTRRVETNKSPHHHLVCTACKSIADIDESDLGIIQDNRELPDGFKVERYSIDVLGLCAACQASPYVPAQN